MVCTDKVVVSCALTGVLTNPDKFPVPVTPEQMADAAEQAFNAGATIAHCHFRSQEAGMGFMPTWDPEVAGAITDAIRARVPKMIINMSTGVVGPDLSGPLACMERIKPEMAALNAGSLNYLRLRRDGEWAWPPMLFDNSVEKIESFLDAMNTHRVIPECECFDTGILRSVVMFDQRKMLGDHAHVSLVMGVASGMPAKASWLPLLIEEMSPSMQWQVIAIGRQEVWDVHQKCAELGGNVRTGLEDTFYLPDGSKAESNGALIEALVSICREVGREIATPEEARSLCGLDPQ